MGPGARLAVVAWLAVAGVVAAVDKRFNITIGYLPALTGELRDRQGLTISGALTLALEEINNSTEILPDVKILLEWHDIGRASGLLADPAIVNRVLTDMISSGVAAFFLPESQCHAEALIAQSNNLPMISVRCTDYLTSNLSNFVRLDPIYAQTSKSVISLLRYNRWNKFSILYEELWDSVALTLERQAQKNNMTVNHRLPIMDSLKCCQKKLLCCSRSRSKYQLIGDTKNMTRIYVFLGSSSFLVEMMSAMDFHNLFAKGEYMVIFVDNEMEPYTPLRANQYFQQPEDRYTSNALCPGNPMSPKFKKKAQSLLVVTLPEPASSYLEFLDKVRQYDRAEPFNFPDFAFGVKKHISIYAKYLYDSVKMYATALDDLIKEDTQKEKLTYAKLMSIATNGSRIVAKMSQTPYKNINGMSIGLDERADSEDDISVLAFKSGNFGNNCSHNMIPVGHFQQNSDREYPFYKLNPRLPIDWAGDVKPEDEPQCGFRNEKCPTGINLLNYVFKINKIF